MNTVNEICFGCTAPSLFEQLYGCEYDDNEIKRCQHLADAISDLWIASLMTDSEVKAARKRLGKRIFRAIK